MPLSDDVLGNVQRLMGEYGWSQAEFARRIGWPKQTFNHLATGRRSIKVDDLETFADVLRVPVTHLLAPQPRSSAYLEALGEDVKREIARGNEASKRRLQERTDLPDDIREVLLALLEDD